MIKWFKMFIFRFKFDCFIAYTTIKTHMYKDTIIWNVIFYEYH